MHVKQPLRTGALVQVIDVLRDQQQIARPSVVEARQCLVRSIWLDRAKLCSTSIVEGVDKPRVAAKGFRGADIFDSMSFFAA